MHPTCNPPSKQVLEVSSNSSTEIQRWAMQGTSIAVDSNGDVHISYYDDINGDLKYAALQGVHPWNVYGYSISPALPAGLSLNFNSGEISGTPTALSTNTTYTITARNTGGANTTTITIEVVDQCQRFPILQRI